MQFEISFLQIKLLNAAIGKELGDYFILIFIAFEVDIYKTKK
jgi:hypothetical protein